MREITLGNKMKNHCKRCGFLLTVVPSADYNVETGEANLRRVCTTLGCSNRNRDHEILQCETVYGEHDWPWDWLGFKDVWCRRCALPKYGGIDF